MFESGERCGMHVTESTGDTIVSGPSCYVYVQLCTNTLQNYKLAGIRSICGDSGPSSTKDQDGRRFCALMQMMDRAGEKAKTFWGHAAHFG
jgi:hypothetical protein